MIIHKEGMYGQPKNKVIIRTSSEYTYILHMYIYVANSTVYEKMKKGLTYHKLLCSTSNFQIGKAKKKSKVLQ